MICSRAGVPARRPDRGAPRPARAETPAPLHLPKLCGADVELGNFVLGTDGSAREASEELLRAIAAPPIARRGGYGSPGSNPQDWGRKFLPSGSCFYIDLQHLECCTAETLSAWDHVAAWHATLRVARQALTTANAERPRDRRICALVNNSDGLGHSYGSHVSFLLTRTAWNNLFERKLHQLLWLAAFQVSSIVYTGAGKVGAENGTPPVAFQLAQRADFFATLTGEQTTYRRPIVNSRDEALCGEQRASSHARRARLHCIFHDATLCHVSTLLRIGCMQIVLAMLESEVINPGCLLDDPVAAVTLWSHDATLQARARLASGELVTAVELQLRFLEDAERFVAAGGCDGIVPGAADIVTLWADTLAKLRAGDLSALAGRLDWVLKLVSLHRALQQRPALTWASPEIKHLDFLYGSLDDDGLYWAYERSGMVQAVVSPTRIAELFDAPPDDSRAWTRGALLKLAQPGMLDDVDWDRIRFRLTRPGSWPEYRTVRLPNPLGHTRARVEPLIAAAESFDELLDWLQASPAAVDDSPTFEDWARMQ